MPAHRLPAAPQQSSHESLHEGSPDRAALPWLVAVVLACAVPALLAFNEPPSPTFLNQAAALALWGAAVAWLALAAPRVVSSAEAFGLTRALRDTVMLQLALAAVLFGALVAWQAWGLPSSLALSAAGMLAACAVVVASGATVARAAHRPQRLAAFFGAWLVAGVLSAIVACVQVFAPDWPDGDWVARSGIVGRAVGNLRQPNHLSSLLLWSAIALVPLVEMGRLRRSVGAGLLLLFTFALVLSGSRTGMVGMLMLALWGALDRRLSKATRLALVAAPILFLVVGWLLTQPWAGSADQQIGAAQRLAGRSTQDDTRWLVWRDALVLLARHPWTGVGFGEFNFAWSLTPMPNRATAFFDHTHNLPLQVLVELGWPLGLFVLAALLLGLWRAWRLSWRVQAGDAVAVRAAFMFVLLIGLHSQLEYPLWYAYFLLPAAFAWGVCLGAVDPAGPGPEARYPGSVPAANRSASAGARPLLLAGIAMVIGAAIAFADYSRVVQIFVSAPAATPLAQRIADGRQTLFFSHHADYAEATIAEEPSTRGAMFSEATHYLLDTRLMIAWAQAYAADGDLDRARHLADRLREFHNPASAEFFAACEPGAADDAGERKTAATPFQCARSTRMLDWTDFRRP